MRQHDKLTLLHVEDQLDDELLLLREFRRAGIEVVYQRVQTAQDLAAALAGGAWDLVVSDFQMPQFSGWEALHMVRRQFPDLPFIIVSGAIGEETAVEIIRKGADDYLMKHHLQRLLPVVERVLREGQTRQQRRQAEKQLEEMRLRLEGVIQSAMDAIVTIDEQYRIIAFNAAAETMFGYRDFEVVGAPLNVLLPQQFRAAHNSHINQYSKTSKTSRSMGGATALLGLRKDGTQFPLEASISQVQVNNSKYFTAIIRDVTERELATLALAEEKQRLELALKVGNLGLWDWRVGQDLLLVDMRWSKAKSLSAPVRSFSLQEWVSFIVPEDRENALETLAAFTNGKVEQKQFEYRIINKAGELRWMLSTGAVTEWTADGTAQRVLGTFLDITEKKQAAEHIRKMELEMLRLKLQEQRTTSGEFLKGQEQERQRLARELHDGIGQLLNVHKIQLSMEAASEEAVRSVDDIISEVVRINNNLMPLVLQDFGLEPGVRQLMEMYRKVTTAELYFFSDLQAARFEADLEAGAYRIIQEATSNAVKYAAASQISIQLTRQENHLLIMIEDDGKGFVPQEKMHGLKQGFGLLNMHYRAEALGGQIEIDSKPDQGCLINVILPIRD